MAAKKKTRKRRAQVQASTQPQLQPQQPQVLQPEKPGIGERLKNMFSSQQQTSSSPTLQLPQGQVENPRTGTSSRTSAFEQTAAKLEDEYGGGAAGSETAPGPEPEPAPQIVSPEAMRKILAGIFNGMAKVHGEHWRVSEADIDFIEPFNTGMVTEMVSKWTWLRESEYKATIAWAAIMAIFIGTRSKVGAEFLKSMMEKIASLFGSKETPTKDRSPESPAS